MQTIVVGVDGSEAAGVALEFAVEEAQARGASLKVICAWEAPLLTLEGAMAVPVVMEGVKEAADVIVAEAVGRAKELAPDLPCEGFAVNGWPQAVLVEESQGALMIVVGRRGQSGLATLLLGSVSRHVADHATCPVVVVPPLIR